MKPTSPVGMKPTSPVKQNAGGMKYTSNEPSITTSPFGAGGGGGAARRAPCGAPAEEDDPTEMEEADGGLDGAEVLSPLEAQFNDLCDVWAAKPHGISRPKAWKAFRAVCEDYAGNDVLASASTWAAAVEARYLPRLEAWLVDGAWLNEPPLRRYSNGHGSNHKRSAAEVAAELATTASQRERSGRW